MSTRCIYCDTPLTHVRDGFGGHWIGTAPSVNACPAIAPTVHGPHQPTPKELNR